jgi:hypothetical protein
MNFIQHVALSAASAGICHFGLAYDCGCVNHA